MNDKALFELSYNPGLINKPLPGEAAAYAAGFLPAAVSIEQLIEIIKSGYAISAQFKNNYRKTENFLLANFIAADIDDGLTLQEALAHTFIKKYASLIYTTPSHTLEANRFRIVFQTPSVIKDRDVWKKALQGLGRKLGGDPAVKDAARLFYGNQNAEIFRIGKKLNEEKFQELLDLAYSKIPDNSPVAAISYQTAIHVGLDQLLVTASGEKALLKDLPLSSSIYCPIHVDKKPSAFVLQSKQGVRGIHCASCQATFRSAPIHDYNFDALEELITECEKQLDDTIPIETDWFSGNEKPLSVERLNQRYLSSIKYQEGITLIKSPKGSGKTVALKGFVDAAKAVLREKKIKSDFPKSVLLIGHRQTLLREACHKLGLTCYLDAEPTSFYGICLDSLGTRLNRSHGFPPYDLVILDESEQVFSHLASETITNKSNGLAITFQHLAYYIKAAKAVIALDADLGAITMAGLSELKKKDWKKNLQIIVNEPKPSQSVKQIELYRSKGHLIEDLIDSIQKGERCFVACNSKKKVDDIEKIIKRHVNTRHIKITSASSQEENTIQFVKNITTSAKDVDVILASPSLGTGVDITFPNDEVVYPNVYGIFEPFINTHTDIDQQLARVRHPKNIKIYINPRGFAVETDPNVIIESLGRGYLNPAVVKITESGELVFDREDPLLKIYAQIRSYQNASKSKILENFKKLKEKQGWIINPIDRNKKKSAAGNAKLKIGKDDRIAHEIKQYLKLPDLAEEQFLYLYACHVSKKRMSRTDKLLFEKALIEKTLGIPLTKDIAASVVQGGFLDKLKMFHQVIGAKDNHHLDGWIADMKSKTTAGQSYLSKMPKVMLLRIILLVCGFIKDGKIDLTKQISQDDLSEFITFCEANRVMIGEILGNPLRMDLKKRALMALNPILGEMGLALEKQKSKKRLKKVTLFYGFNPKKIKQLNHYMDRYQEITDHLILEQVGCVKSDGKLDYPTFISKYGFKRPNTHPNGL